MSAGSLGGGRYISVALSGLVELPGLYISYHLLERYAQGDQVSIIVDLKG